MKVKAIPSAGGFGISFKEGKMIVRLRGKPERNEANKELLREMKRIAGRRAYLIGGTKSREKEIAFEGLTDDEAIILFAGVAEPGQKK